MRSFAARAGSWRIVWIGLRRRVLDVGAGDGTLLDALGDRGRDALGLERVATRPDIRAAELDEIGGRWSAIVFWHSIEHMRNPGQAFEQAVSLRSPKGVLVIALPNADSLQARVFGDTWLALDLPRHLVHVPAGALLARLRELHMRVERVSFWRGGQVLFGWLAGMVKALPPRPGLYNAIRRPEARREAGVAWSRPLALCAAGVVLTFAGLAATVEILSRRSGTVYVEARRA